MVKKTKKLIALLIAFVMCISPCLPGLAASEEQELYFLDFETEDPTAYFAAISSWNDSGTKAQFTIETREGEDSNVWGKSLKYVNGPANEQGRIALGGAKPVVGFDFSFCFESVPNDVKIDFRQSDKDLYAATLTTSQEVKFFENTVATYETGVWYDMSLIFDTASKYARFKFKESSSDEWKEFDGFYPGTVPCTGTSAVFYEMNGTGAGDGIKYFDNLRIYIPGDDFKPSLSTYSDDFEGGINHSSGITDYTSGWKSANTNSQTEITAEPLEGYEGNVLKLKDVSSDSSQVNLTVGKYPFSDAGAPDVRHLMTYKLGADYNGGHAAVFMKYVTPARTGKTDVNLLTLEENRVIMTDKEDSHTFDAKIEPGKLYDVTYLYDAKAKVAVLSVVDGNGDTISKILDMGFFEEEYGYLYNIEFTNSSTGENTTYVDDFSWDINTIVFDISDSYVRSGKADEADIDETVIFEYTDMVEGNISPEVEIKKDGEIINAVYEAAGKGNTVQIAFEELERGASYEVTLSGIKSVFGDPASEGNIEFTTSDYSVDVESISASDGVISAELKGSYRGGVEAYIVASAYDAEDNLTEAELLPIEVPYRAADTVAFAPSFDGEYSYIKGMIIRSFSSAISYSGNVPEDNAQGFDAEADGEYAAITSVEVDEDTFTVYGENVSEKDSIITIQVLESGKTWSDLSEFDYENGDITEILSGFDSVDGVEYGEGYTFTQKLPESGTPVFRIRFGEGLTAYYDPILMANISGAETAQALEEIVKADAAVWDDMASVVNALDDDAEGAFWQILFETKELLADNGSSFELPSDVTGYAPGISALARLSVARNAEALGALFADFRFERILAGNSYDIYAGEGDFDSFGMSASQKSDFLKHIYSDIEDYVYVEDFITDFEENAVFYAINNGSKAAIDTILSNSDLIDADEIPTYFELSDTKKENVCGKIGTNNRYTSISALLAAVEKAAKSEKRGKSEPAGGGGGSGGGGGGGGGGSSVVEEQTSIFLGEEDKAKVEGLPFADIENVEWAQKAITALADAKIVEGNGAGSFNPNNYVTREEFVKMLVLTLKINNGAANESFDDIDSSDWCYTYVCAATGAGIVNGIDADTFGKGRVISREEMATMTYRALSKMGVSLAEVEKEAFNDTDAISDWAKEACTAMHRAGIINGMGNNHFAPGEYVTRAQAAKILYEVMTR